jgi:hypothetical protein
VTDIASFVHSGSYGAELGPYPSPGLLSQTITTVPGQRYVLSLWLDNPPSTSSGIPNQFIVQWNGTTLFNQSNIPNISWTNLQYIVSATSASTVLQFEFSDNPYYLGLDDISLTPIPTLQNVVATNGAISFAWGSLSGTMYQVQYATNLTQTNWSNLGAPITATGNTLTATDFTTNAHRFYRVLLVP